MFKHAYPSAMQDIGYSFDGTAGRRGSPRWPHSNVPFWTTLRSTSPSDVDDGSRLKNAEEAPSPRVR
jgi:hypothetical protein